MGRTPDRRLLVLSLVLLQAGCAALPPNSFIDPTAVGRFPTEYAESGIRRVLTPRDAPYGLANAVEPAPDDLVANFEEYRLGPLDQIGISIDDLIDSGRSYQVTLEIDPTGYVRIPRLGRLNVTGMTEFEVEEDLRNRLRETQLLPNPVVQTFITLKRSQFFSAIGSVRTNGPFALVRPDTRLLDVLAQIGDVDALAGRLYVIRRTDGAREGMDAENTPTTSPELIVPPPDDEPSFSGEGGGARLASDTPPTRPPPSDEMDQLVRPGAASAPGGSAPRPLTYDSAAGKLREAGAPGDTSRGGEAVSDYDWGDVPEFELSQKVLEIDLKALRTGDPKQNIVIRDRDVLYVPIDTGVFYLMGEINRPGVYTFDNREITIKQAIGAIGAGFTPLAWPQRVEIVRREPGTDKQLTIPVDVDAVFAGLADDVLLRDGDLVNVGTHVAAPFLFVIRNSFRFTYGFGFVYDRNFADVDSISGRENPETVSRREQAARGLPF